MFNKKQIEALENQVRQLQADLNNTKNELLLARNHIESIDSAAIKEMERASVAIDFNAMSAFSVERQFDRNTSSCHTVIGYFLQEGDARKVKEWYLPCSPSTHEALCKEFAKLVTRAAIASHTEPVVTNPQFPLNLEKGEAK